MAVPAALSPAIMMSCSARLLPVRGCAARIPANTTAAVPCHAETHLKTKLQVGSVNAPWDMITECAEGRYHDIAALWTHF